MAFWTDVFMNKMRNEWLRRVDKIQYYSNGNWYDAVITNKSVNGNMLKIISVTNDNDSMHITSVRIIDISGDIAGEVNEDITKTAAQGVITVWEFPLYEIKEVSQ
ncbi:MAG: hypothetical protein Q4D26_09615 [Clostridia bacterium]|nr:hypothetical protein [Clostridia bacterium]